MHPSAAHPQCVCFAPRISSLQNPLPPEKPVLRLSYWMNQKPAVHEAPKRWMCRSLTHFTLLMGRVAVQKRTLAIRCIGLDEGGPSLRSSPEKESP